MHVFGHDQKHLHRAETLPKFKHNDFAYALLLTDRHADTAEIRSQNSNNDQHNYNTIENAVVLPCIYCQKRSQ